MISAGVDERQLIWCRLFHRDSQVKETYAVSRFDRKHEAVCTTQPTRSPFQEMVGIKKQTETTETEAHAASPMLGMQKQVKSEFEDEKQLPFHAAVWAKKRYVSFQRSIWLKPS